MKKIYTTGDFRKEAARLYSQSGKFNCYIQNISLVGEERIIRELQEMSAQAQYLLKQINPN